MILANCGLSPWTSCRTGRSRRPHRATGATGRRSPSRTQSAIRSTSGSKDLVPPLAGLGKWGYSTDMTMSRERKAKITSQFSSTVNGEIVVRSASPRQLATYGKHLPARFAAHFNISIARQARRLTRTRWVESRLAHRVRWTRR